MLTVNRNDPCPCGSGKKYKKCCLPKLDGEKAIARQMDDREWAAWFADDCAYGAKNLAEHEAKQAADIADAKKDVVPENKG